MPAGYYQENKKRVPKEPRERYKNLSEEEKKNEKKKKKFVKDIKIFLKKNRTDIIF